jgi:hypothetical protein
MIKLLLAFYEELNHVIPHDPIALLDPELRGNDVLLSFAR